MATGWYVLHTYSGYENKIDKTIRMMIDHGELDKEIVRDVKVPSEEVVEVRDGKKRTQSRKFLPGYILIEMDLPEREWKDTTSKIRKIQGVTGFVGTPADRRPSPLTGDEARGILQKSGEMKGERPVRARQSFAPGEQVKIVDGPFESFTGTIEEVNQEKSKLKVMVGIFGRNVPVEVDLLQVEKV
ncbi:transcription termination/antitermination protein NusG [Leadbettera azotonutricia]|uniref:Transcription termination/antitermination protein NusG n=1 Tax=Leadbettera azotonutricia (strain ATCC BAA-888 / DSM 13862 / ZAS-9) TaxID=545695 RepID=F5YG16_LEAAZ|nr:transcription termination/antitermination protein NusG [Leadbettera azotonutricia]AEF83365.1 transcription termination/antitermination factor NusG [Leadbettera azotonutricia ZAS-9]